MRRVLSFVLVLVLVAAMCGCSPEKAIVGTWTSKNTVLGVVTETTYVFRADGTGERSGLLTTAFTYTITEDALELTTSVMGLEHKESYAYRFEGKKLTLTGGNEPIVLEKVD
jgi:hypothetical protein